MALRIDGNSASGGPPCYQKEVERMVSKRIGSRLTGSKNGAPAAAHGGRELESGMKLAVAHLNPAIRRRALVLLASCPDGCTKAMLAAHNISDDIVRRLTRSGLAVA